MIKVLNGDNFFSLQWHDAGLDAWWHHQKPQRQHGSTCWDVFLCITREKDTVLIRSDNKWHRRCKFVGREMESCGLKQPPNNWASFPGLGLLFWKASDKVTQQFIWLQSRSSGPPGLSPSAAALHQSEHFKSLYCLFAPSQIVLCAPDERLSAN